MNDGLQRLKTAWDMGINMDKVQNEVSMSQLKRPSKNKKRVEEERKELIEPAMKINAYLKSLSVYIPLDADTE